MLNTIKLKLNLRVRTLLRNAETEIGSNLRIGSDVKIAMYPNSKLKIGEDVSIGEHTRIIIGKNAELEIGSNTNLTGFNTIYANKKVSIGENCAIAIHVVLVDSNHDLVNNTNHYKEIVIGDNVWLGAYSIVLAGVVMGGYSVLGANSTLTKSIPSYSVAVGNPAKVIKYIERKGGLN